MSGKALESLQKGARMTRSSTWLIHQREADRLSHLPLLALVGAVLLFGAAAAFSAPPEAVSPGSAAGSLIGDSCPTFSWGNVPGAEGYELVVYSTEEERAGLPPVLNQRIAGSASSWTPSLDRCLERGGSYAWSVRAMGTNEPAEWSAPRLFDVAAGPSQEEFDRALVVVQQYLASSHPTESESASSIEPEPATRASAGGSQGLAPATTTFSVDGNVHAMSFTGDGSNLDGVTSAAESVAHASDAEAHHSRYSNVEAVAAVGPHTTDTTCHGQACNGANFTGVNAVALGGLPPAAYSQGPHLTLPDLSKGDMLVRTDTTVVRLPVGKNGQVLMAKPSAPGGVAWVDLVTDTIIDAFTALGSFAGNDGTIEWSSYQWIENDADSGGPNNGWVRVVEEESCTTGNCLRIAAGSTEVAIARQADLAQTPCVSAELSFDVNNQLVSDTVRLEISSDGGQSFSMLKDYDGTNTGAYCDSFDVTGFISYQTQIRMRVLTPGGQFIYFDNVMISCSGFGSL